jgi:hypothetical protein
MTHRLTTHVRGDLLCVLRCAKVREASVRGNFLATSLATRKLTARVEVPVFIRL